MKEVIEDKKKYVKGILVLMKKKKIIMEESKLAVGIKVLRKFVVVNGKKRGSGSEEEIGHGELCVVVVVQPNTRTDACHVW